MRRRGCGGSGSIRRDDGLTLTPAVAGQILAHARDELPNEATGLLSGDLDGRVATGFHPARNVDASPLRYNVHPEDLVRIVYAIEEAGEDMVGIVHSHTRTAAVPSPTDRRTAEYPRVFHVIASMANPDAGPDSALRAWRIHGGHAYEVPLVVADRSQTVSNRTG